jgi:hypothetical protein
MAKLKPAAIGTKPAGDPIRSLSQAPSPFIPENAPQATKKPRKLLQKTIDAIRMCEAGIEPREALKMTNFKDKVSATAVHNLKLKVKEHSLTEPSMVKAMSAQVKRILKARAREEAHTKVTAQGEIINYTDNIYPTDSNILAACAMVADRVEPIIHQNVNLNLNADLSPIDLSKYASANVKPIQAIEQNVQAIDIPKQEEEDE